MAARVPRTATAKGGQSGGRGRRQRRRSHPSVAPKLMKVNTQARVERIRWPRWVPTVRQFVIYSGLFPNHPALPPIQRRISRENP
jgi:hypothetical protein